MAGNVDEWVHDWYSSTYYTTSPYENPTGPNTGTDKVLRGGSWLIDSYGLRVAYRGVGSSPGYEDYGLGFRCAYLP